MLLPMSTLIRRRRRLSPGLTDFAFRLPESHLDLLKEVADENGWSAAEAIRRGLVLFFRENMDITDSRYSLIDDPAALANGHASDE